MVKLYCDKCQREIRERYYTININENYITPSSIQNINAAAFTTGAYQQRYDGPLQVLNSQKMYCASCKKEVEGLLMLGFEGLNSGNS